MAGPSRHGVHLDVRPAHADDQMQRSGLQDAVTNHPQVALPFPKREPGCVLVARDVLALPRPLDPVLARPSDGTSGFTTSVAEQLPTPLFNGLPPLLPASQQPANLPSNGERINSYPTLNRREARLAALRGKISLSHCDVLFTWQAAEVASVSNLVDQQSHGYQPSLVEVLLPRYRQRLHAECNSRDTCWICIAWCCCHSLDYNSL